MEIYHYYPGKLPILLSIPHAGTYVPDALSKRFVTRATLLPDTDWHVEELYAWARKLGLHILIATHSRYVIDLNRAPDDQSLYPGKFTTGLCPHTLFDASPIYQTNQEPTAQEIHERIKNYWQPYHEKLSTVIDELKNHKRMVLLDAHSIRSHIPTLFEGRLPDLNLGTADGTSADNNLSNKIESYCKKSPFTFVCNGRFKGGYITRHYGNPMQGVNAMQLELAQHNYMQEDYPFNFDADKAKQLQQTLQGILSIVINWTS